MARVLVKSLSLVTSLAWALVFAGAASLWAFWLAARAFGCPYADHLLGGEFACLGVLLATLCSAASVTGSKPKPGA